MPDAEHTVCPLNWPVCGVADRRRGHHRGGLGHDCGPRVWLILLICASAALPPAPGYATPFGIMMGMAIQMIRGAQPVATRARSPAVTSPSWHGPFECRRSLGLSSGSSGPPERAGSEPRLFGVGGVIVLVMSISMSMPIPLSPARAVVSSAPAFWKKMGWSSWAAWCCCVRARGRGVYYAWTVGLDAVESQAKPFIKGLLGLVESNLRDSRGRAVGAPDA